MLRFCLKTEKLLLAKFNQKIMIENRKEIPSPFMGSRQYDVQRPDHPVQEEVRKCLGSFSLNVTIEEDRETLKLFRHLSGGIVGFLVTMRRGLDVIGVGRGMSVFNAQNKFVERNVTYAKNAAMIDCMVRSVKLLDTVQSNDILQNPPAYQNESHSKKTAENFVPITDKQKGFLWRLLQQSDDASEEEFGEIDSLSKDQARIKINQLVGASGSRTNY
jgi:hypothetical protein